MALLDDMATYLQENGIGVVGTDIFKSARHDTKTPETAIALYEYAGRAPAYVHDMVGAAWENPSLHIEVRAKRYATARGKADSIFRLLDSMTDVLIGTRRYISVRALQSPFDLGPDENGREIVACNFAVEVES